MFPSSPTAQQKNLPRGDAIYASNVGSPARIAWRGGPPDSVYGAVVFASPPAILEAKVPGSIVYLTPMSPNIIQMPRLDRLPTLCVGHPVSVSLAQIRVALADPESHSSGYLFV